MTIAGTYWGLGGQIVTCDYDCGFVVDGPGPDFTIFEVSSGSAEFTSIDDVLVSHDGVTFLSVHGSEAGVVRVPGDDQHTNDSYARSYDLAAAGTGVNAVRYIRIDGAGTGASGSGTGFDLDAMGADCDLSGRPDECEADCNSNGLHDSCDIADMTSADDNANTIPDECEGITLTLDGTDLLWTPVSGALGYDAVQGDLGVLRSSAGNFTTATDACSANDHAATTLADGVDPAVGEGYWYLIRGILGTGILTYDTFGAGQVDPRDAEIDASGVSCP